MSLSPGTRLGPYEVIASLGAGGMGEVYRARDTRLNRTVAIKSIQAAVAGDPERVARFEREAQLLASLNHPNIGAIHGLQEAGGATYLVLEFVDGQPLDQVIAATRKQSAAGLDIDDAISIAKQMADAIAAAHERGIIHRDLKPANVMVTADGKVKVLDFGLGKALGPPGSEDPGLQGSSNSPTMTLAGTQAGIILGTAGYMSPEQAKGRAADKRSDVWSFGCVLFELLAGSRAFEGEDITDTIAAIVRGEPNWKALPATTPPALRTLLQRTLIKDRAERLPDMSVVRYALGEGSSSATGTTDTSGATATTGTRPSRARWPLLTAVAVLSIIGTAALMYSWRTPPAPTGILSRFSIVLPEGDQVVFTNTGPFAIAPDGRAVVYPALRAGKIQLFVYDFSTGETRALEGTDGARSPFFHPEGRWIGFFANRKLKKITIGGTALTDLADAPDARGGAWGKDDMIYYAPTNTSGLWMVSASGGGTAAELTKVDPAVSEISHRYPHVLPDGKTLLFIVWTGPGSDEHRIEYLSIADSRRQLVIKPADGPIALVGGNLIYAGRQDTLLSAPWSPDRPSLDGVEPRALPFQAQLDNEGAAAFAVSENGTFVHLTGDANRRLARIVWVDRSGRIEPLPVPERDYVGTAISPDGTRAALPIRGNTEEIWIVDFRTKSLIPLATPDGSSQAPVWTKDSKSLVYRGTRNGFRNLFIKASDGSGSETRLTTKAGVVQTPICATPDGKWVIFTEGGGPATTGGGDIWKVALDGAHDTAPVVATSASETGGQVSPDGRWLAFESLVSGVPEIWIKPFDSSATPAAMSNVSRGAGDAPLWSRDGKELFFQVPAGIMAVTVNGDVRSEPRLLFEGSFRPAANANTNYDVAEDRRFLHVQATRPTKVPTRIDVVLNGIPQRR